MTASTRTMRDAFLDRLCAAMAEDARIFIVSDDFGAPALDKIRASYGDRFVNTGIAEQNAINVAAGLALEGYVAYAYGIAGFMTMRCYEQIRTNLAMAAQVRPLNANIVGVGAGISYDLSGPSHHCIEDLTAMRLLPNLDVFSPSDWVLAAAIADHTLRVARPKYIRLDSKALPPLYDPRDLPYLDDGFHELKHGRDICLVATGYMTHVALRAAAQSTMPLGVVDVFAFPPLNASRLLDTLEAYRAIITIEEGLIHRGGLDMLILDLLARAGRSRGLRALGFDNRYLFEVGDRAHLHRQSGMDEEGILRTVRELAAS